MAKYEQIEGGTCKGDVFENKGWCNVCHATNLDVVYDSRTKNGLWAWLCEDCFKICGTGLGIGHGQKYQRYEP